MLSSPEMWKEFFETYYRDELNKLAEKTISIDGESSINVDFLKDLIIFKEGKIAEDLLEEPDVALKHANEGLSRSENIHEVRLEKCTARFYNLPISRRVLIRDLRSEHISKFVSIEGIVRKVTEVRPRIIEAAFMCSSCGKKLNIEQEDNTLKYPYECRNCNSRRFILIPEESKSIDSQRIKIQEYPENLRGGEQPQTLDVILEGDLTGVINPGDRVVLNGVVRAFPRAIAGKKLRHMDIVLEGNSIEILQQEYEEFEITEEDKKKILELSDNPEIFSKIVKSIAPAIYGHEDVKMAVALQLFGGVPKKLPDGTEIRGDAHVLLVGDPGVAKCVDFDTEILLADGGIVKIGELINSNINNGNSIKIEDGFYAETCINVASLDSRELKLRTKNANIVWKRTSPDLMYEVRTKTGRKLKVTPTHPFFTIRDGEFTTVKAKELKKGDLVATPLKIPIFGKSQNLPNGFKKSRARNAVRLILPEITTPEFWRFIGLFIAEGYSQKSEKGNATMFFTNNDEKLINEFFEYAKSLGLNPSIRLPHTDKTAKEVVISSIELYNFFELLGITGKSNEKKVPDLLFKCSKDEIRAFLSAFFDAEASVNKKRPKITVTSASYKLLKGIQHLLLRFGIVSQLHDTYSGATNSPTHMKTRYSRLILTGENSVKFNQKIGFTVSSKVVEWDNRRLNPNLDVIPGLSGILKNIRRMLNLSQFNCGVPQSTYQHLERGDRKPSRSTLEKVLSAFKERCNGNQEAAHKIRFLELLLESDIFWDEIVEIKKYKPDHPFVYDLQVPEHHNFIANDIFVHNSQLLRYVHRIAPRSVYTTGKGTTSAGLTASATRDEYDGRWTLEAGALVLADKGVALVDEIDKMRSEDRGALHEAMEQQTVSVAKAGINAVLRARCALLGAANPKYGRFDRFAAIAEQIDLSPTLLSRFDLIFVMTDDPDEVRDRELAKHILDTHELGEKLEKLRNIVSTEYNRDVVEMEAKKIEPAIDPELLRKYIAYAKRTVFPVLTEEAKEKIIDFYLSLRSRVKENSPVPVTARQLEALIRLAEASARLRLRDRISLDDIQRVIRITRKSLEQIAIDPETGEIDIDYAFTGTSKTQRDRIMIIKKIVEDLSELHEKGAPEEEILNSAEEQGITRDKAKEIIYKMREKGELYCPRHGYFMVTHNY
jgi:replicative DNA helicase Mcm